eukprot:19717-Rhodomonas_salina.2
MVGNKGKTDKARKEGGAGLTRAGRARSRGRKCACGGRRSRPPSRSAAASTTAARPPSGSAPPSNHLGAPVSSCACHPSQTDQTIELRSNSFTCGRCVALYPLPTVSIWHRVTFLASRITACLPAGSGGPKSASPRHSAFS